MEVPGLSEGVDEGIDARAVCLPLHDIIGEHAGVLGLAPSCLVGLDAVPDSLRVGPVDLLPVIAPRELLDELLEALWVAVLSDRVGADFPEREDAVSDVG